MKTYRLTPTQVTSNPDRVPHDHPATVRWATGETDRIALPLVLMGLKDDIKVSPITKQDRWNAQGLEGACELATTWARAFVLSKKLSEQRGTIIVSH